MDALEKEIARTCLDLREALNKFHAADAANKDGKLIMRLGRTVVLIADTLETLESSKRNAKR